MQLCYGGKGKVRVILSSFSFSPSSLISKVRVKSVGRMCVYSEAKIKPVKLVLCSISTVLVRTKYIFMYEL